MNVSAHASLFSSATLLIPATRILLNGYKDDRFEGRSHILDLPPEILSMIIRNIASRPELPSEKQWHDLVSYATDRRTLRSESEFLHSCEWYLPEVRKAQLCVKNAKLIIPQSDRILAWPIMHKRKRS